MKKTRRIDHSGKKYNKLTVIEESDRSTPHNRYVVCRCECGNITKPILMGNIIRGTVKSCGCLVKRGKTGKRHMTEWQIWRLMIKRCHYPKDTGYKNYGGRGISVCPEWRESFEAFYRDMGPRPNKLVSLDRRNNNGNYEPSNCRWADNKTQSRNRRTNKYLECGGWKMAMSEWADILNINYATLRSFLTNNKNDMLAALIHYKMIK